MEFRKENGAEALGFACNLKQGFYCNKIRFIVQHLLTTALKSPLLAEKFWALCFDLHGSHITPFFQYSPHSFEYSSKFVTFRIIEGLWEELACGQCRDALHTFSLSSLLIFLLFWLLSYEEYEPRFSIFDGLFHPIVAQDEPVIWISKFCHA